MTNFHDELRGRFIFGKAIVGDILGCVLGFFTVCFYVLISFSATGPMDGNVTLGELYDATMVKYPQIILVIGLCAALAALTSILPALKDPDIPGYTPDILFIRWMFLVDCLAGALPAIGYCAFGWVGFAVGCLIPFVVFPWHFK